MAISPSVFKNLTNLLTKTMSAGRYDVRLAQTEKEIKAAQALRYQVLFKEGGGKVSEQMHQLQREDDEWDDIAYHVIVIDKQDGDAVVGTMRLVSNQNLEEGQDFYTEKAFDISALRNHYDSILELSRACVAKHGRGGAILLLIWKFTMQFIEKNQFDVMIGCASFAGTNYHKHLDILSYLYDKHLSSEQLMPKVRVDNRVCIKKLKRLASEKAAQGKVPTMLKGYLKIGAKISDCAVIDSVFNSTFVMIYVDAKQMFASHHALVYKSSK